MHELHNWSSQGQSNTLGDSIAKSSLIPIGLPTIQFLIPHNMLRLIMHQQREAEKSWE